MTNTVELLGFYGSDEIHGLSAWVSTKREMTPDRQDRLGRMLETLATNGHHTPFEKSIFHFLITTDVATHIHILKHRIGVSLNAESARYKEFKGYSYYIPDDWPEALQQQLEEHYRRTDLLYHSLCKDLTEHLGRKRAKESARFVLPYGHQITADVSFNFRSFMHFYSLRGTDDAQREIHELAIQMKNLIRQTNQFNKSLEAFGIDG